MKQNNQKIISDLIESTVKVIAREGFDKATTRNIAGECGIADSYIYLYFKDKEDLFVKAYQKEDAALAGEFKKHLSVMNQQGFTNEDRLYFLFSKLWMHLISYPDSCRFFVQYYFSPYYQKCSAQAHAVLWTQILEQLDVLFQPGTEVKLILRSALNMMLSQAIKAGTETSNDENTSMRKNYELIFGMVRSYLSVE